MLLSQRVDADACALTSSAASLALKYNNAMVFQPLSKSFGLATAELMHNVKALYNVSKLTRNTAVYTLGHTEVLDQ